MKNEQLDSLITELKKTSSEGNSKIWKRIALDLDMPTKKRRTVNLSKIDMYSEHDDIVVVPGKVLSMGNLSKKITVAAYAFSKQSIHKIKSSGSKAVSIRELAKKAPRGRIKIIG